MNLHNHLVSCPVWCSVLTAWLVTLVDSAEITVRSPQGLETITLHARLAAFSAPIRKDKLVGYLVRSVPADACSGLSISTRQIGTLLWANPKILLVQEGPCSFYDQTHQAERAGFIATIIIIHNTSDILTDISFNTINNISIPALLVDQTDGYFLWNKFVSVTGSYAVISEDRTKTSMNAAWELPVAWSVLIVFVIIPLTATIVVALIAGRCPFMFAAYTNTRHRVRLLRALPVRKFSTGGVTDDRAGCSICLESYRPGDSIRKIVPCGHEFHKVCVDSWLLNDNLACPLCRSTVLLSSADQTGRLDRIYAIPLMTTFWRPSFFYGINATRLPGQAVSVHSHVV